MPSFPRRLRGKYIPRYPAPLGRDALIKALAALPGFDQESLDDLYTRHVRHSERHRDLPERDTLSDEEAFAICALIATRRPPVVVEIGTHFGRSTRRLIDMQEVLGLSYHVECYDVIDRVQFFDRDREATLHLEDVTGRVSELLLNRYGEGVIFLDARPRRLIEDLVAAVRDDASGKWALVVHDCGRGLYNEAMGEIDDDAISSNTGVWERHVVAAAFDREPAGALHGARRNDHVLEVLETRHGLGIVVPVARSGSGHSQAPKTRITSPVAHAKPARGVQLADAFASAPRRELPLRLNVTESTIERWEMSKPRIPDERKLELAKLLDVTPSELMGWD